MNALTLVSFACLVFYANASGIIAGYGARFVPAGPTTLVGSSGVVGPNGAAGPSGVVTSYGAIGPNGIGNAVYDGVVATPSVVGGLGLGLAQAGIARVGLVNAYDDGQWRGEGLWESQDHARSIYGVRGLGYGLW